MVIGDFLARYWTIFTDELEEHFGIITYGKHKFGARKFAQSAFYMCGVPCWCCCRGAMATFVGSTLKLYVIEPSCRELLFAMSLIYIYIYRKKGYIFLSRAVATKKFLIYELGRNIFNLHIIVNVCTYRRAVCACRTTRRTRTQIMLIKY